ncbi:hypothetical protein H206_02155 [Candidatus Electrothrix aarhusensis]|uniref:DUF2846 domain-containing protein n=1 Tax=Candidatus Electrothrix aarhusensis TaxID=1859131 RepID=A0A3S4T8T4_9BACT|nr:hypothetical protein H206_02155 [Candidatus Electrothrix aarhusensis]
MSSKLILTRDKAFSDFARKYKVVLDDKEIGEIKNGGTFESVIPSGPHSLKLTVDWCGSKVLEFDAAPDQEVRINGSSNLRGWRILKVKKVMSETPDEWIRIALT